MLKVNLADAFATFDDYWNPKIAGAINDSFVKLVKLRGAFDWHHHEREDELFTSCRVNFAWGFGRATSRLPPENL